MRIRALAVLACGVVVVGCASDGVQSGPAPGDVDAPAVVVSDASTTTVQDLDDLVHATDRPATPTLPAGYTAASDATARVVAIATAVVERDGPFVGEPGPLVDAIGSELLLAFTGCEVEPAVSTSVTGVGPAVGTIELSIGCDPTTDGLRYTLTLDQPGAVENETESWRVAAAVLEVHCTQGIRDGLCV